MNTQSMTRKSGTVYIVDDDRCVRKSMSLLVQREGYTVITFTSAQEFLDFWEDASVEGCCCLVLDVAMPGLNGIALQEALVEDGESMQIVFITGHGNIPMSVRAMKKGASDFLVKPVRGVDLLDAIELALSRDDEARGRRAEIEAIRKREKALTPREREVMKRVITGMLNKQIAAEMGIEEGTVKIHRRRVMAKMCVSSVAELVTLCSKIAADGPATEAIPG